MSDSQIIQDKDLSNLLISALYKCPERMAIKFGDKVLSYRYLYAGCTDLVKRIKSKKISSNKISKALIVGTKNIEFVISELACFLGNVVFIPTNHKFPNIKIIDLIKRSQPDFIIINKSSTNKELISIIENIGITIIYNDELSFLYAAKELSEYDLCPENSKDTQNNAYILFTSGTTGDPKAVSISRRNLKSYIFRILDNFPISNVDRLSQLFDFTFDLSIHDVFVSFSSHSTLILPNRNEQALPFKYIKENKISVFFCVPSTAQIMLDLGILNKNVFPDLRLSLFCGEPLNSSLANIWSDAAPKSEVYNLYGPTEATIAFTFYKFEKKQQHEYKSNIVPIGIPFKGLSCFIEKNSKKEDFGELILHGDQVTLGYLNDRKLTDKYFPKVISSKDCLINDQISKSIIGEGYYKTGDIVSYDKNLDSIVFRGRNDSQIKILGYRVEILEIEYLVKKIIGMNDFIAVPITKDNRCTGLIGFIKSTFDKDYESYIKDFKLNMPSYMVPKKIIFIKDWPKNLSGKVDRKKLLRIANEKD